MYNDHIMNRKGFTLIELLVVISIISVLSSIVFASLNNARVKSREARRLMDMHQIMVALELYATDYGGLYPTGVYDSIDSSWDTLASTLAPYISPLPRDPINDSSQNIQYTYGSWDYLGCTAGKWYLIQFVSEGNTTSGPGVKMCDNSVLNAGGYYINGVSQAI